MNDVTHIEDAPSPGIDAPPRVSIGLPVYNAEEYLEQALDSILNQTFDDFELVICDNQSTDATEAICRAYAERDKRIRYYRNEENEGAASNFRRVFERSRGRYFRWACYDDLLEPDLLEACVDVLDDDPDVILAFSRVRVIGPSGDPVDMTEDELHLTPLNLRAHEAHERFRTYLNAYFPVGGMCNTQFGVIRREALEQTNLIADYVSSDKILLGELALEGRFERIPRTLFLRRFHPRTSQNAHNSAEELANWFKQGSGDTIVLPHWAWLSGLISAVTNANIKRREKLKCFYQIARRYVRHTWRDLVQEARAFIGMNLQSLKSKTAVNT